MKSKISLTAISIVAILLSLDCSHLTQTTGNGSGTGNAVVGILYQSDGITPAAGVRVHIRPRKSLADTSGAGLTKRLALLAALDSVVTDSAGRYAFDTTLDTGTYVITSASGNNAVLIDSVAVKNKAATDSLAPDTLKPAGALKGVIKLSEGGDPRKVFILAFGIDRFARVNTDGSFKFSGLAEAKYDLRLISSLDNYGVLDTNAVPVHSADTTNLDTIILPFTGIPTPKNVKITYDTLKQIVTLTWSKADTALVKSYNVYRRNVDSNTVAVRINASPVADTIYRDSTGVQGQMYEYRVAAVGKSAAEGGQSPADSVKAVSWFVLGDSIGTYGTAQNQLFKPRCAMSYRNLYLILDVVDPYPSAVVAKFFDLAGNFVRSFVVRQSNVSDNVYNMAASIDSADNLYTVFKDTTFKYDASGNLLQKYPLEVPEILTRTAFVDAADSLLIFALNPQQRIVEVKNLDGDTIASFGVPNGSIGGMGSISADKNRNVFIGDRSLGKVYKYDLNGNLLATLGAQGQVPSQFGRVEGVTTDSLGRIYVDDSQNDFIYVFSNNGSFFGRFETHMNTARWYGTVNDNSEHLSLFLNSTAGICLLEGNVSKKLFIYQRQ